jgi:hypothetical protein
MGQKSQKPRTALLAAAVISILFFPKINAVAAANSDEVVWVIKRHETYLGMATGYLGTTGAKVVFPEYKIEMVAKAPSWKVLEYNEVSHAAFEVPWDIWVNHGFRKAGSLDFMLHGETKKSFDKRLKLNVITVRHVANEPSGPRMQGFYRGGNKDVNIKIKELTYTNDVPLSPKSRDFIHGFVRAPVAAVLPLSYSWFDETGRRLPVFTTDSIERTMMNPSIFDYPKTFKLDTEEDDVLMGGVRKNQVEGVFDDLLGDDKDTAGGAEGSPKQNSKPGGSVRK